MGHGRDLKSHKRQEHRTFFDKQLKSEWFFCKFDTCTNSSYYTSINKSQLKKIQWKYNLITCKSTLQ